MQTNGVAITGFIKAPLTLERDHQVLFIEAEGKHNKGFLIRVHCALSTNGAQLVKDGRLLVIGRLACVSETDPSLCIDAEHIEKDTTI